MDDHHVDPAVVVVTPDRPHVHRAISDAVGLETVAMNRPAEATDR